MLDDFRILLPAFEQVRSDAAPCTTCPDVAVLAVSPRNPPRTLWKSPATRCRSLPRSETEGVGPRCPYTSIRPPRSGDLRSEPNIRLRIVMGPPWPPTGGASFREPDMTGTLGRLDTAYTPDRSEVQSRPQTRRKTPCQASRPEAADRRRGAVKRGMIPRAVVDMSAEGVNRSGTSLSGSHTAGSVRRAMCSGACPAPPPESAAVADFC